MRAEWEFDTLTRKRRYLTTRRQVSESRKRYSAAKRGNVLHKGALGLCCAAMADEIAWNALREGFVKVPK